MNDWSRAREGQWTRECNSRRRQAAQAALSSRGTQPCIMPKGHPRVMTLPVLVTTRFSELHIADLAGCKAKAGTDPISLRAAWGTAWRSRSETLACLHCASYFRPWPYTSSRGAATQTWCGTRQTFPPRAWGSAQADGRLPAQVLDILLCIFAWLPGALACTSRDEKAEHARHSLGGPNAKQSLRAEAAAGVCRANLCSVPTGDSADAGTSADFLHGLLVVHLHPCTCKGRAQNL